MAARQHFAIDIGWRALFKDMGIRADHVLRRAGLPEDLLLHPPESGLSTAEYFRFWRSIEVEIGDPLFPLQVVGTITTESFVPPIFAALCSANMRQAVQRLAKYKPLVAPMRLDSTINKRGDLTITPHWLEANGDVPVSMVIAELAFLLRLVRIATREPIAALNVSLSFRPEPALASACEDFFACTVRNSETSSLTLCAADAERPFLTSSEALWQAFEPELRRRLLELDVSATTTERVRALLLELLPSGDARIKAMAARLALSKRTLQRRLEDEGENFRDLVSRTREELARHYLTKTSLSGGEIAFLLGFDNPNSFFRAFHDWTGQTPETLRLNHRKGYAVTDTQY